MKEKIRPGLAGYRTGNRTGSGAGSRTGSGAGNRTGSGAGSRTGSGAGVGQEVEQGTEQEAEQGTQKEAEQGQRKKQNREHRGRMHMDFAGDSESKYKAVGDIAEDVLTRMTELCQSGFDTVHDSTIQGMEQAAVKTRRYGMKYLSELLEELAGEIAAGRHQMERKTAKVAELYAQINEYLYLCRQKVTYDRGMERYAGTSSTNTLSTGTSSTGTSSTGTSSTGISSTGTSSTGTSNPGTLNTDASNPGISLI